MTFFINKNGKNRVFFKFLLLVVIIYIKYIDKKRKL